MVMGVWRKRGMTELTEHGWLSERKQSRIHLYLGTKQIVFVPLTHTASLSTNFPQCILLSLVSMFIVLKVLHS